MLVFRWLSILTILVLLGCASASAQVGQVAGWPPIQPPPSTGMSGYVVLDPTGTYVLLDPTGTYPIIVPVYTGAGLFYSPAAVASAAK